MEPSLEQPTDYSFSLFDLGNQKTRIRVYNFLLISILMATSITLWVFLRLYRPWQTCKQPPKDLHK
ncbi:MAG: hypothetical protein CME40_09200 [Haliea sp.]|nr:hypothetical protein [Haliea sp.]|tara:strand:- start:229474 stop:229671 length:198 start_codon:yes stop_codon:yes gene_type:complete